MCNLVRSLYLRSSPLFGDKNINAVVRTDFRKLCVGCARVSDCKRAGSRRLQSFIDSTVSPRLL